LKNTEFVRSVNKYQLPSVALKRFLGRRRAENIKYKFRFAPKFPSFGINQKCSIGVGSLHIFNLLNVNGGQGGAPQLLEIWGYTLFL